MGSIDYKSQNPDGLAITPSEYDKEFVVESIIASMNNFELIDNVHPNNLANQNRAPCQRIKKRAENKGFLNSISNAQLTSRNYTHSESGQLKPRGQIQFDSKSTRNQSTQLHSFKKFETLSNCKISVSTIGSKHNNEPQTRNKRFKGRISSIRNQIVGDAGPKTIGLAVARLVGLEGKLIRSAVA